MARTVLHAFAEMQGEATELHVLPLGKWDHPVYGEIEIDSAALAEFVKNFDAGVRLDIPITEGHEVMDEKPAIGWFKELVARADGLWATVEWTARGLELLQQHAYKYFSPEYYLEYNDPETRKDYSHVLVGGALTNKPYFRELRPVMFSEPTSNIIIQLSETMNLKDILAKDKATWSDAEKQFVRDHAAELSDTEKEAHKDVLETPKQETAEERQAREEKEKGDANEAAGLNRDGSAKETPAPVKQDGINDEKPDADGKVKVDASELAIFRETSRKLEFREVQDAVAPFVFSATNKEGRFLPAQKDAVEKFAFSLNKEQRTAFAALINGMPKAAMFKEVGSGTGGEKKAFDEIKEKAAALVAKEPALSMADAIKKITASEPELKKRYEEEQAAA